MHILDTDIYSLFRTGHDLVVKRFAQTGQHSTIAITIVTKLEVLRGRIEFLFKADGREELMRAQTRYLTDERKLSEFEAVRLDEAAVEQFLELQRAKKLRKLGRKDLLIASIALARPATLVTRNLRDFRLIPGLRMENWAD